MRVFAPRWSHEAAKAEEEMAATRSNLLEIQANIGKLVRGSL